MPKRVQLSRARGWRKPEGVVVVSRPTKWGNPHKPGGPFPDPVFQFKADLLAGRLLVSAADVRAELRGKDLACWCPPGAPCHADVLLEVANR